MDPVIAAMLFAGLCIGAWALLNRIIGLCIDGAISAVHGVLLIGAYLMVVGIVVVTPSAAVRFGLIALVAAVVVALPHVGSALRRKVDREYHDEKMEGYRAAIRLDPRNLAARSRLADALCRAGRIDEAIDELTEVVRLSPRNLEDARRLERLIAEREERKSPPVMCSHCGEPNDSSRTRCIVCEQLLYPQDQIKEWLRTGGLRKILWETTVAMSAVILLIFCAGILSPVGRLVAILLTIIIAIGGGFIYFCRRC